jgi:hypothetical protein
MNNDEMRNIINISEGIVKNSDGTPKAFKRTEQMKASNPTGIDRFLGRGKTMTGMNIHYLKKVNHRIIALINRKKTYQMNGHMKRHTALMNIQLMVRWEMTLKRF